MPHGCQYSGVPRVLLNSGTDLLSGGCVISMCAYALAVYLLMALVA